MWPSQLAFLRFMACKTFLAPTLHNISSLFTRSVQLIFSILLWYHIPKLAWCFWSTSWRVQVPVSKLCSKCSISLVSSLNLHPISWWKEPHFCLMLFLPRQSQLVYGFISSSCLLGSIMSAACSQIQKLRQVLQYKCLLTTNNAS